MSEVPYDSSRESGEDYINIDDEKWLGNSMAPAQVRQRL